jgi:tetratricopeptide (TPR) repeat protein
LQLRLAGNVLALGGDLAAAVQRYTAALAVQPQRGQHLLHSNLAAAYLQLGEKEAALEHAQLAVEKGPRGFHNVSAPPVIISSSSTGMQSASSRDTVSPAAGYRHVYGPVCHPLLVHCLLPACTGWEYKY